MALNNNWFGRQAKLFYPFMQDPLDIQLEMKLNEMSEREQYLKAREADVRAKARLVHQQSQELKVKQANLSIREKNLESRSAEINNKEKRLASQEKRLTEWEQSLQRIHEKTVRQAELAQQLEKRQQALEGAVARYRQERANWESTVGAMPESNYRKNLEEGMQSLVERFGQTFQEMQTLRNHIRALDNTIRECDWDAVDALCELHRRLESLNTEEALREADYLTLILKKHYQLQPIEPVLGSPYSDTLHERLNREHGGQFVVRCFSKGWMSNGDVVRKALVDTADTI